MAEACTCVTCSTCRGSGSYVVDRNGHYVGPYRRDDLDDLSMCEDCWGSGIAYECDNCHDQRDIDQDWQAEP